MGKNTFTYNIITAGANAPAVTKIYLSKELLI